MPAEAEAAARDSVAVTCSLFNIRKRKLLNQTTTIMNQSLVRFEVSTTKSQNGRG